MGLGLSGLRLGLGQRGGSGEPPIITATVAPVLTALTDAQTPADGFTSGTYASTAGTISSEVAAYLVNGSPEASGYDLTAGDTVRVSETVTDSAANERVFYTSTITVTPSVALSNTAVPVLSGTFEVGETVSSTQGTWAGSAPRTYAYQWLREGEAIVGATSSTYALVEADEGADISCEVTADDGFTQVSAESTAEAVTWPAPVAAGLISAQSYAENVAITPLDVSADFTGGGITYALAPTSDALPAGLSLSSAGILSGTPTEEATSLSIVVRGTNSGGFDDTTFSLDVEAALTAPVISGVPTISGTTAVGSVLTATPASATPTGTNTWQWERAGTPISGATSITYTLVEADEGSTLTVVQTCTNGAGSDTAESAATATITYPAPVAAGALADQSYTQNAAITPFDTSSDFTGSGITYALSPSSAALPTGLSLSSAGVISGTPTATVTGAAIIIRGTNSGGFDDSGFSLTVSAAATAPAQFGTGDWSVASGDTQASVTITTLPDDGGATITDVEYQLDGGSWVSSGGTTSFTISSLTNDTTYSVSLRAVNSVGSGTASATKDVTPAAGGGGDITLSGGTESVIDDGGTYYHVLSFTTSGTLSATASTDVEYLVVGGGGGGAARGAGGGGAGEVQKFVSGEANNTGTAVTIPSGSTSITIGAGGAGGASTTGVSASNGSASSVGALVTAIGGGGGANSLDGNSGGSGGSTGDSTKSAGAATGSGLGNSGGSALGSGANRTGGGGGGAGAAGGNAATVDTTAGDGGDGISCAITGASVPYGGGGGGSGFQGTVATTNGGVGGGGSGGSGLVEPTSGEDGKGGGGGAAGTSFPGAVGGSGLAIVRYEISQAAYEAF